MKIHCYSLCFTTPAFLGNASQSAEWRTPPIKAQLRHFWRMVQAACGVTQVDQLRSREHALFGSASDATSSGRSQVRLRLDHWSPGELGEWGRLATRQINVGNNSTAAALYLGFGPLTYKRELRGPGMEHAPAIAADSSAILRMAVIPHAADKPQEAVAHLHDLRQAAMLMHHFGTLGGRSRNGWGSYRLEAQELEPLNDRCLVDWQEALQRDWPCGLGQDAQGMLVWRSAHAHKNWEDAIVELAQIRANVNRCGGDRTLLSYPVTKKSRPGWKDDDRLPSNLRFKVVQDREQGYRAQVAHFPCAPAQELSERGRVDMDELVRTWQNVHAYLNLEKTLVRVAEPGALQ